MAHVLFLVAHDNFRDEELFMPKDIIERAGHVATIGSRTPGTCYGKRGGTVEAVIGLHQINAIDFDAIVWIGGSGSHTYFDDPAAHLLVRQTLAANNILAAICAAPCILARAGVLKNIRVTCFPADDYRTILTDDGAIVTTANVERDGAIVTADGPESAAEFGATIVKMLAEKAVK